MLSRIATSGITATAARTFTTSAAVAAANMPKDFNQIAKSLEEHKDSAGNLPLLRFGDVSDPAVIVLQEWWGINGDVKDHARQIAARGYEAVIPDLYRGKSTLEVAEAEHLMNDLDFAKAITDLDALIKHVRETKGCAGVNRPVVLTGFCMGSILALATAAKAENRVDGVVGFYGVPSADVADLTQIKAPVQAHFGVKDPFDISDPKASARLAVMLAASGVEHEIFNYEEQGHGFLNSSEWYAGMRPILGAPPTDPTDIELAWSRFFAFVDKVTNKEK
ncbi:hypothetical protein H696_04012 [Fonticula alba]|uniref:Dienelactone hydrolase domain-containing protein n=1 Tax=Fonticula alba TaxID=691883 RepID=A0A058Z7U6_FONAL|nr:hypothetical protein H696_04012 [Fonticula alba]KCV69592.1 hypothetical protein H696_04012 [Fonticula alba]|eukprot:XP_009496157.1 hypothetical protein H696_04012 [Fonticula alba]